MGMLPASPWLSNTHVLLTSYWRHSERILLINTLTSSIIPVPLPPVSHLMDGSMQILHIKGSRLLALVSTPVKPAEVWLLELSRYKTDSDGQWVWNVKEGGTTTPPELAVAAGEAEESEGKKEEEWSVGRREKVFIRWELVSEGPRCLDPRVQERLDGVHWDVLQVQPPGDKPVRRARTVSCRSTPSSSVRPSARRPPRPPLHPLPPLPHHCRPCTSSHTADHTPRTLLPSRSVPLSCFVAISLCSYPTIAAPQPTVRPLSPHCPAAAAVRTWMTACSH